MITPLSGRSNPAEWVLLPLHGILFCISPKGRWISLHLLFSRWMHLLSILCVEFFWAIPSFHRNTSLCWSSPCNHGGLWRAVLGGYSIASICLNFVTRVTIWVETVCPQGLSPHLYGRVNTDRIDIKTTDISWFLFRQFFFFCALSVQRVYLYSSKTTSFRPPLSCPPWFLKRSYPFQWFHTILFSWVLLLYSVLSG